jgi:cyclopropane fatty-acyl-phospholipid synthase-like methyltransferase
MNPNKALWENGDFTRIAVSMRQSGEALVKTLGVTNGLSVLDLGCDDGTTALPRAAELQRELEALFTGQNQSATNDRTSIPATFQRVTVSV